MRLAAERIPLRGVGKRSFLQAMDVARGAPPAASGERLAEDGAARRSRRRLLPDLRGADAAVSADARELVAKRRERRAYYQSVTIPASWRGTRSRSRSSAGLRGRSGLASTGLGVSSGVVEGAVLPRHRPRFADIEPDEVLVSPTTDPSWSSIMFVSSALVVDIGGADEPRRGRRPRAQPSPASSTPARARATCGPATASGSTAPRGRSRSCSGQGPNDRLRPQRPMIRSLRARVHPTEEEAP